MLFGNLRLLIVIFFWNLIYGGDTQKTLNGFTLPGIITYLIMVDIFGTLTFTMRGSGFDYSGLIKSGALGPLILKPRNLGADIYFKNLSTGVASLIPQVILIAALTPFIGKYFVWEADLANSAFIIAFLLVGSVSVHLTCSLLGYMAFWLEEANAIMWSFAVLFNMAMGFFIPLDFFPGWLARALKVLPVSSWGYIQTKIFIGLYPIGRQTALLAIQAAWIGALFIANAYVWSRGIKRYSSVGG